MKIYKANLKGLTMIELLIVISIIGILSAVTLNVINAKRQREISEDAVKRSNLEKLVIAVEGYKSAEGFYPSSSLDTALASYVTKWPDGSPTATSTYILNGDAAGSYVIIYVVESVDGNKILKYSSTFKEIRECPKSPATNLTDPAVCS